MSVVSKTRAARVSTMVAMAAHRATVDRQSDMPRARGMERPAWWLAGPPRQLVRRSGAIDLSASPLLAGADELVFVLTGAFDLRWEGGRRLVDANQAVWRRSGEPMSAATVAGPVEWLCLPLREVPAAAAGTPWQPTLGPLPASSTLELLRLERAARYADDPGWLDERAGGLAAAAFASLARQDASDARHPSERVEAVKAILSRRVGERLTLDRVAREVYCSRFHLARQFSERTGTPLHRYLLELRLKHAVVRLGAGERNLLRLAHDLGFCSHSHLTMAMRRELGVTPSRVRAELRSAPRTLRTGRDHRWLHPTAAAGAAPGELRSGWSG
jgi:AraC-like DNA-binding protein